MMIWQTQTVLSRKCGACSYVIDTGDRFLEVIIGGVHLFRCATCGGELHADDRPAPPRVSREPGDDDDPWWEK